MRTHSAGRRFVAALVIFCDSSPAIAVAHPRPRGLTLVVQDAYKNLVKKGATCELHDHPPPARLLTDQGIASRDHKYSSGVLPDTGAEL